MPRTEQSKAPSATNTPDNRTDKYERRIAVSAVAQAVCAVLLVVFTGLLACYQYRAWQAALSAANAAEAQVTNLEKTLAATEKAANAAQKGADVSETAFKLSERPWITLQDWALQRPSDFTHNFRVEFNIRNFGRSPAWITRLRAKLVLIQQGTDFPTPVNYDSRFEKWHDDVRGRVVPPADDIPHSCPFEEARLFTKSEYEDWETGKFSFWIYGLIEYEDFTGDPHETAFSAQHGFVIGQNTADAILFPEIEDHWYSDAGGEEYHYHDRKKGK